MSSYNGLNVCANQDNFNVAMDKAIKQNNKDAMKKAEPWVYVYAILWLIFLIWGILLAMQVQDQSTRVVHLVLAIVAGPAYVLGYYINQLRNGSGSGVERVSSRDQVNW